MELENRGQIAAAIDRYRDALKLHPVVETYNHLGGLLAKQGNLDEAIDHFRAALALDPGFRNAAINLRQALALKSRSAATSP